MSTRIENAEVSVGCPPPSSSRSGEERKKFQFHFLDFKNLCTTKGHYIKSPKFICNGHHWELSVYPGGYSEAAERQVSVYLCHRTEGRITTRFGIQIIDKFGKEKRAYSTKKEFFSNSDPLWGWHNRYIPRSVIIDESQNILDSNGTLTVVVSMEEEPTTVFVPQNPIVKMIKDMFDDETTADVCFEVSAAGETEEEDGGTKRVKSTTPLSLYFYAHRTILQGCAPMLARMFEPNNDMGEVQVATALVDDVKPDIFRYLLSYVYGWNVPNEELEAHAKDIIDAADKYSIVNLKLEAEVAYVKSTDITLDNAMDNLLYADSRNCALLKEAVVNFLADNHSEAAANISFTDCPGNVVKDLLVAFGRNNTNDANETNADELTTLSVSALRRRLDARGLEVDGSREAMIESIKSHS